MEKKVCSFCGKEFETDKKGKINCSIICGVKDNAKKRQLKIVTNRKPIIKNCVFCGHEFQVNYRCPKQIYCSKICAIRINNKRAIDSGRKREERKRYRERHRERINEHDRQLWYKKQFGGLHPIALARDNATCQRCGSKEQIVMHHIDLNPKNNVLENLKTLCRPCHCFIHHKHTIEKICSVEGCGKRFYALGRCRSHYSKLRRSQGFIM